MTSTKVCSACKVEKPVEDFGSDKMKKDGLRSYCRECDRRLARERGQKAKDKPKVFVAEKLCLDCNVIKPRTEFHNCRRSSDGLHHYCKECMQKRNKEMRVNLKEREPTVEHKVCVTCEVDKPASDFYKAPKRGDGLTWECKECTKNRTEVWEKNNPEKKKENDRRKAQQWQKDGRMAEADKRWHKKYPNYQQEYNDKNRDKVRMYSREYARLRRRDPVQREKMYEARNKWTKKNPEMNRLRVHRRDMKKRALPFNCTKDDIVQAFMAFDNRCAYCGVEGPLTIEHVIPVSREDVDNPGTVQGNLMPLCKSCNSSKKDKTMDEYFVEEGGVRAEVVEFARGRGMSLYDLLVSLKFKMDLLRR